MNIWKKCLLFVFLVCINYKLLLCDQDISISNLPDPITFINNDGIYENYKPISYLGHGVQGSVFLIENIPTKEKFALKVHKKKAHSTCDYTAELFKKHLWHENIIKFYGYYNDINYEYLLFEYLPITLFEHLYKNKETFINFLFIMKQMLDVLNFLQTKKIVFVDFKFDNVMLTKNLKVKVIDFGLAHFEEKQKMFFSDEEIKNGDNNYRKYLYIAPEIRNGEIYNSNADIYSLGYILCGYIMNIQFDSINKNDFLEQCCRIDPKTRISADMALLHPLFNILYDFVFCFAGIKNFEVSGNNTKIRLTDKIIYYEHPDYGFELHCCCLKNKREFSKLNLKSNPKLLQRKTTDKEESEQRTYKLLNFRAIVGNEVLPIQHLSFSYFNELKIIFSELHKKHKKSRKKNIYIFGGLLLFLVIGLCVYLYIIHKRKYQ